MAKTSQAEVTLGKVRAVTAVHMTVSLEVGDDREGMIVSPATTAQHQATHPVAVVADVQLLVCVQHHALLLSFCLCRLDVAHKTPDWEIIHEQLVPVMPCDGVLEHQHIIAAEGLAADGCLGYRHCSTTDSDHQSWITECIPGFSSSLGFLVCSLCAVLPTAIS